MRHGYLLAGLVGMFSLGSVASATTCTATNWVWATTAGGDTAGDCGSNSSSGATGISFTNSQGQVVTLFAEQIIGSTGTGNILNATGSNRTVNGLFEVQRAAGSPDVNPPFASGIAPWDPNAGGSPFDSQLGISEAVNDDPNGNSYSNVLYLQITGEAANGNTAGDVALGTTLSFLMQEGDVSDDFNVWTGVNPTSLNLTGNATTGLTELYSGVQVSANNTGSVLGGVAVNPQFSIQTTAGAGQTEYIAIEADCQYLVMNSIASTPPTHSGTPEPRFYGLLLVSLLAIPAIRRRFAPVQ